MLGNGTWLNGSYNVSFDSEGSRPHSAVLISPFPLARSVGGNQGISWGGLTAASQTGGAPYDDYDGGKAVRCVFFPLSPRTRLPVSLLHS